jgi:hypothetical protein
MFEYVQGESMSKNEKGFGVIEVLLIFVILGIIGFTGWRVYEANREVSQVPVDKSTVTKTEKSTIPKGWKEYENKDLGFSFAHPETWGEVSMTNAINEGAQTHEGGHYYFKFSKYDPFKVATKTADYKFTGLGRGSPHVDGFTNFDTRYNDILKFEQNTDDYHGDIVKKDTDHIVYTSVDAVAGDLVVHGIARTTKLPGLDFAFIVPIDALNLPEDTISKLMNGEIRTKQYFTQEQIDTVIKFAENVKSL